MTKPYDIQQRTFDLACRIVTLHKYLLNHSATARSLASQLLRAGTSIGANLEEAHGAQSRADFTARCSIALKEARETKYWLRLLSASKTIPPAKLDPMIQESSEIIAILTTIRKRARSPKE